MILSFPWHWRPCDDIVPELPSGFRGVLGALIDPEDDLPGGFTVDIWEWACPVDRWVHTTVAATPADAAVLAAEWCLALDGGHVAY